MYRHNVFKYIYDGHKFDQREINTSTYVLRDTISNSGIRPYPRSFIHFSIDKW